MQHLAIIPDGNRRWAAENKLKSLFGHKRGLDVVRTAMKICIKRGIKYLSLYTFSLENFKRSEVEKSYLFKLLSDSFKKELPELVKQKIKVKFCGDRSVFPEEVREAIDIVEHETKDLNTLYLNLLFCYGGRQELVQAVKKIATKVQAGYFSADEIDENRIEQELWVSNIPDPDLIIRTGKTPRLSNFLLYQAAYSEILFLDYFWPEVTEEKLEVCIDKFSKIKRNFGK
jgi:undecaprenyl diphosphate synthase